MNKVSVRSFSGIPKKVAVGGMTLCLRNARVLLRQARILSYRATFVLVALSLEETGKVPFLTVAAHKDWLHASHGQLLALGGPLRTIIEWRVIQPDQADHPASFVVVFQSGDS